jgi:hypothetical protein
VKLDSFPKELLAKLNARPKGCASIVTRLTSGKLKVEEWRLDDGATLVEVSRTGRNNDADLALFREEIVAVLLKAGVVPLDGNKTELSGTCR